MNTAQRCSLFALVLAAACGGDEPPPQVALTLAEAYDVVGVLRVLPDGLTPTELQPFRFELLEVTTSGGRVLATARREGSASVRLSGELEPESGMLRFDGADGAFTGPGLERLVALGGRAIDGTPEDGVADEINGYIRTATGAVSSGEGSILAVSRYARRPAAPSPETLSAAKSGLGRVTVRGTPGAAPMRAAVEVLRFRLEVREPEFRPFVARDDGSFVADVEGLPEDLFVVRIRQSGRVSDAVVVPVTE